MKIDNDSKFDPKDYMSSSSLNPVDTTDHTNKRVENLKIDNIENLNAHHEQIPIWEIEYVDMIEQMRTIPYVNLAHFKFMTVNWVEDHEELMESLHQAKIDDKQASKHWEMVKKMIFSKKISKLSKDKVKPIRDQLIKNLPLKDDKSSYAKRITNTFVRMYMSIRKRKMKIPKNASPDRNQRRIPTIKMEKIEEKKSEGIDSLYTSNRSIETSSSKSGSEESLEKNRKKLNSLKRLNRKRHHKSRKKLEKKKISNSSRFGKRLSKPNNFDLATSKRFYKLSAIMSKDDGPFVTDYSLLLGIDFWSNYCNVEKSQLISVVSNDFWLKKINSLRSNRVSKELIKISKSKKEHSKISELKQFVKGTGKPVRAPQRVISNENKFRLIPYPQLFNPNTDLRKTFPLNTTQDQLKKSLRKIYKVIVWILGGRLELTRQVAFEEAYEDSLLWVLDTYQAKTRFIALLNDQIKREIY